MPERDKPLERLLRRADPAAHIEETVSPDARAALLSRLADDDAPRRRPNPLWLAPVALAALAGVALWRSTDRPTPPSVRVALATPSPRVALSPDRETALSPSPSPKQARSGSPALGEGSRRGDIPLSQKRRRRSASGGGFGRGARGEGLPTPAPPPPVAREILVIDDSQKAPPAVRTEIAVVGAGEDLSAIVAVHEENRP